MRSWWIGLLLCFVWCHLSTLKQAALEHEARGEWQEAWKLYKHASIQYPNDENLFFSLAHVEVKLGADAEAIKSYEEAIRLRPTYFEAMSNLGNIFMHQEQFTEARKHFKRALSINFHPSILFNLMITSNRICDWHERPRLVSLLVRSSLWRLERHQAPPVTPFHACEFPFTPEQQLAMAAMHAERARSSLHELQPQQRLPYFVLQPLSHLRLGYMSGSGFHGATTTARLLQALFERHSRSRFTVFCFSLRADDGSPERARIARGCENFVDLSLASDVQRATDMNAAGLHVLVDLTGFTVGPALQLLWAEVAPLQTGFHGFPGSLGMPAVQFIATDRVTSPPEYESHYVERMLLLPGTYLTNEHKTVHTHVLNPRPEISREFVGLPSTGTIFCSFNQLYKLTPTLFKVWMAIMRKVPNSVLWLLTFADEAVPNLQKAALSQNVSVDRLVFTPRLPKDVELEAKSHCDLFLDSTLFNGHTTLIDVLWTGIPVLAMGGQTFASRVSSGLLTAIGTPELLARTYEEYEGIAVAIGRSTALQQQYKSRVKHRRLTSAPFNSAEWVVAWESALARAFEVYFATGAHYHVL